jgi:hypothetical protein
MQQTSPNPSARLSLLGKMKEYSGRGGLCGLPSLPAMVSSTNSGRKRVAAAATKPRRGADILQQCMVLRAEAAKL